MYRWLMLGLLGIMILAQGVPAWAQENAICTLAFQDLNRNGVRDADEGSLAGISVNLAVDTDLIIATHVTTESNEAHCFENLTPGIYNISFADSPNHLATTQNSAAMEISIGQRIRIEFGAVAQQAILTEPDSSEAPSSIDTQPLDTSTRILLALIGAFVVVVFMFGIGAIIISIRY